MKVGCPSQIKKDTRVFKPVDDRITVALAYIVCSDREFASVLQGKIQYTRNKCFRSARCVRQHESFIFFVAQLQGRNATNVQYDSLSVIPEHND